MAKEIQPANIQTTRQALKQDTFVTTTGNGLEWATANRRSVILTASILLAVIVAAVVIGIVISHRAEAARTAFGEAMHTYQTDLATPGQPALPGQKTFPSAKDRATAANGQFRAVADKYGSTEDGKNARYFEGVTYIEEGQNASAESTLKQVSSSWDSQLASLAKLALADLYRQTGRDPQAIDLLNQLSDKPTDAVPYGTAQLQLADLYTAEGKPETAKTIYAKLKDKDGKSAAGTIAAQKLNPAAAPPAQPEL